MKDRVHDVFGFGKCHDGDVLVIVGQINPMGVASYSMVQQVHPPVIMSLPVTGRFLVLE
jgi:hypothetical protein